MPFLFRLLGGKALLAFALTSLSILLILTATNVSSQHGLKQYVEEQVGKLPWDITIYQQDNLGAWKQLRDQLRSLRHVKQVESLVLVTIPGIPELKVHVDGKEIFFPWVTIVSATQPALLPPELALAKLAEGSASVVTFGPQGFIQSFGARVGSQIDVGLSLQSETSATHNGYHFQAGSYESKLLSTRVSTLSQVDRSQFLKWLLSKTGSISFISPYALTLYVPPADVPDFLSRLFANEYVFSVGHADSPIIPEVTHLISVDRSALVSGWDLAGSSAGVQATIGSAKAVANRVTPFNYINSDLGLTLSKLAAVSRLVRLASVAVAFPLLWVTWIFTSTLAGLVALNQRRTIGLLRLRGVPGATIRRGFSSIMLFSSLGGALGGLILGVYLPVSIYRFTAGERVPSHLIPKIQDPLSSVLYVAVAGLLTWIMARKVLSYVMSRTPVEAVVRVSEHEASSFAPRISELQIVPLLLGSYKLIAWLVGFRLEGRIGRLPPLTGYILLLGDSALNLIGPALFLYGIISILAAKFGVMQRVLLPFGRLVGGRLSKVMIRSLALKYHRVAQVVLTAALLLSVSLYPQVSLDTFNDHVSGAAKVAVGASMGLVFDAGRLTGHSNPGLGEVATIAKSLVARAGHVKEVEEVTPIIGFMPTISLTGASGHTLYFLDPTQYLRTVNRDDGLGIGKPFHEVIGGLTHGVAISKGFADRLPLKQGDQVPIGRSFSGDRISSEMEGIVSYLPGIPSLAPDFREGYAAAEIEYLTSLFASNPYMVASMDTGSTSSIAGTVSDVTLLVKLRPNVDLAAARSSVLHVLPFDPDRIRTVPEEMSALGKDMFIHLSTGNMRLIMWAGILISLSGILVLFLVNYAESKRIFSLLRLRGASPSQIIRLSSSEVITTAFVGVLIGSAVGIVSGYGVANHLRTISLAMTTMATLPSRIIWSSSVFAIILGLTSLLILISIVLGAYVFRRTARESLQI
ncbi:MAG: ABC transporter permease [Acidobacteria bacterium]|nr:ABC transporter permease [Acidobacteriota bacterium]